MALSYVWRSCAILAALAVTVAATAQTAPPCPATDGAGPPGGTTDLADAMSDPLAPFLDRVSACEVGYDAAATALFRARLSDDPSLRPPLRRVVDAWHAQDSETTGYALVALAVLGEDPDYFIDQVEAALVAGNPQAARYATRISWFFADSSRYARLQQIQAQHPDVVLELWNYWDFAEDSHHVDDVFDYPVDFVVGELIAGLRFFGFQMLGHGDGLVSVSEVGGDDTFTPENVFTTLAFRRLGAADTAAVRAAVEASPAYIGLDAQNVGYPGYVAAYRRAILSAALPGESLTSDTFSPPLDTSLLYPPPACQGTPATVYVLNGLVVGGPLGGTPYAGRLVGTDGPDVILGTSAADVLEGLAGDDALCGAAGDDALDGGDGTDTADGGLGTDGCDDAETATACEGLIPTLTLVRPFAECVTRTVRDGSFTAVFGYENLSGQVGRVPAGDDNHLEYIWLAGRTGEVKEGATEVFALPGVVPGHPGQTPPGRRAAFSIIVPPDDSGEGCTQLPCRPQPGRATWTLLGQTATADPTQTPQCPAP